jgi:maltose/moltooligosaccharide transporter
MIVIPMFLQTISFGYILKHFLNNDPGNAILFGGVLLLIAAFFTTLLKYKKPVGDIQLPAPPPGH